MPPRRSPLLHPQFRSSEEGAGMARRRSPRHHPQIQASEEGAGVSRRRSPRLRPEIHASNEVGAGVTRRTGTSPATAAASLLEDDDMLREILLRLPPLPSSLPRASAVCKRWRGLVTDPKFHRQFYAHHRKPPLLGVFERSHVGIVFNPILDPPDRITPRRLTLGRYSSRWEYKLLDCRHGLVLLKNNSGTEVVLCDPITSEQRCVAVPTELRKDFLAGAVLCAASDLGHVHGDCDSSPFKVVLLSMGTGDSGGLVCVYSSEAGVWSNLILTGAPCYTVDKPAVLIGNCLYWLCVSLTNSIVEFDLDEHIVTAIEVPPCTSSYKNSQVIKAEDGALGFAALSYPRFQMWRRSVDARGVATWVQWKTIAMSTILGLPSPTERLLGRLRGYDEDNHVVFLLVRDRVYMVQLKSMQSRKLHEIRYTIDQYYPFTSFYTPDIAGGSNGAEILHNTYDSCVLKWFNRGNAYGVQLKLMQSKKLCETHCFSFYHHPFKSFYIPGMATAGGLIGAEMLHIG